MDKRLYIGSAQFGLPYGITNTVGKPTLKDVKAILDYAKTAGIDSIDTAQAYGDAEEVLGRVLHANDSYRLTTKMRPQKERAYGLDSQVRWTNEFYGSLDRLGCKTIDTVMIHSSADLIKPGGELLYEWLVSLKERNLASRIGLSIYDTEELAAVEGFGFDIIQLPVSVYDQSNINDQVVASLVQKGCALQARSIFLQGLLVAPVEEWPRWISKHAREHHKRYEEWVRSKGSTLLGSALGFIRGLDKIDSVVIGVTSVADMREIVSAWGDGIAWKEDDYQRWALPDKSMLDPRSWPKTR